MPTGTAARARGPISPPGTPAELLCVVSSLRCVRRLIQRDVEGKGRSASWKDSSVATTGELRLGLKHPLPHPDSRNPSRPYIAGKMFDIGQTTVPRALAAARSPSYPRVARACEGSAARRGDCGACDRHTSRSVRNLRHATPVGAIHMVSFGGLGGQQGKSSTLVTRSPV